MTNESKPTLGLAAFLLVDALFLGLALAIYFKTGDRPLTLWEAALLVACTALAAWSITYPVLRRYADSQKASQSAALADAVAQIGRLQELATQISSATTQWQSVNSSATKVAESGKQILLSMDGQVKAFAAQLEKADDAEKRHLRLEIEKLRRGEIDWLQVMSRVMDHIYALNCAAQRSGQTTLIDQLGQFQEACRDAARRIGLLPILVEPGTKFDPQIHQLSDESATPPSDALVESAVMTGYTYQGQLIRRAMVELRKAAPVEAIPAPPEPPAPAVPPARPAPRARPDTAELELL